ncbi:MULTISPECIES: hypothetical protein [Amycolatopsis]|uniref:Uncharacterized protein n=1 Tax=Amycolatopsis bullii TaxID=941987 RepID=A0ABQ3KLT2_9PSEU|nr:hypothetical protein [Amycolatopsis bullii]GHG29287.1 hypothetical protein GCM10017567_56300 [Amycolatopsis bullii]
MSAARHAPEHDPGGVALPDQGAQQPRTDRRPAVSHARHATARNPRQAAQQPCTNRRPAMSRARHAPARNPRQTTPSTARHHVLIGGPR